MAVEDKDAKREYQRIYRIKNRERLLIVKREWYLKNRELVIKRATEYNKNNPEKRSETGKRYYRKNKEKHNKYVLERFKNDLNFKLKRYCSSRIRYAMKHTKNASTLEYIGCTIDELRKHLESKFQEGMSWNNYGYKGWHIDHIKPLSLFDLSDQKQISEAFNYKNTQPLWWSDNFKKGNKYIC